MDREVWVEYRAKPPVESPLAIVGSPGLRSVGKIAVERIVERLKAEPLAEVYSTHFPEVYHTMPSYIPNPQSPGDSGVKVERGGIRIPSVKFYFAPTTSPLVIVLGYHPNFQGQYEVAEAVVGELAKLGVRRVIVLAAHGLGGSEICGAATEARLVSELEKFGVGLGYEGPFYGFSGLVFGQSGLRGMEGMCLFARTVPNPEDPEFPDPEAAEVAVRKVGEILSIDALKPSPDSPSAPRP